MPTGRGEHGAVSERRRALSERYSADAAAYRRHWGPQLVPPGRRLLDGLPLDGAERILDLGAGVGLLLPEIRARAPNAWLVGADAAEGMIRLADHSFPRVTMDAGRLGLRDSVIDVVVMAFMLFHLPDPRVGLQEARRVLRGDGRLGLATWAAVPGEPAGTRIWTEELDRHGAAAEDPAPSHHDLMDAPEKVGELLGGAGFIAETVTEVPVEDATTAEDLLARRTTLGYSRQRFESLEEPARSACLRSARERLRELPPEDFVAREVAILAWARPG